MPILAGTARSMGVYLRAANDKTWCTMQLHVRYAGALPDNPALDSPLDSEQDEASVSSSGAIYAHLHRIMAHAHAGEAVVFIQELRMGTYRAGNHALAMHLLGKVLHTLSRIGIVSDASRVVLRYSTYAQVDRGTIEEPAASQREAIVSAGFDIIRTSAASSLPGGMSTVGRVYKTPKPSEPSSCALQ